MYRSSSNPGASALLIITLVMLGGISVFWSPLNGGDIPIGYPHTISGDVTVEPTQRYVRTDSGGQEKTAITLKAEDAPARFAPTMSIDNEIMLECLSTRCTQVQKGEAHQFSCRISGRFFEENVAVCKHDKKIRGIKEE